jgi:hypothetical protein
LQIFREKHVKNLGYPQDVQSIGAQPDNPKISRKTSVDLHAIAPSGRDDAHAANLRPADETLSSKVSWGRVHRTANAALSASVGAVLKMSDSGLGV